MARYYTGRRRQRNWRLWGRCTRAFWRAVCPWGCAQPELAEIKPDLEAFMRKAQAPQIKAEVVARGHGDSDEDRVMAVP